MKTFRLGILGCGRISPIYLKTLKEHANALVELEACADISQEAASARAEEFGIRRVLSVDELIESADVDVILNLTIPEAHHELNMRALEAGKHVYTEKPMALSVRDAQAQMELARAKGLCLSVAPDTLLGANLQTTQALLRSEQWGAPSGATARLAMRGWHAAYLRPAVGLIRDMAPYYVSALVSFFGPVSEVRAVHRGKGRQFEVRYPGRSNFGETFEAQVPCTSAILLTFREGQVATLFLTIESNWYDGVMEIFCEGGIIRAGDPNNFPAAVSVRDAHGEDRPVHAAYGWGIENHRGIGLIDMLLAILENRPPRLLPEFGVHVTEVLEAMLTSGETGEVVVVRSECERPVPLSAASFGKPFQYPA